MSHIRIDIKKIKPRHEACEVCHQVVDKSETLLSDSITFTGGELDLNQGQFTALKQVLLNASTGFMKALMEAKELEDSSVKESKPQIPINGGGKSKFKAVPPVEEPPN